MTIADEARAYEADALRYMETVEASIADGGMAWVSLTMASRRTDQATGAWLRAVEDALAILMRQGSASPVPAGSLWGDGYFSDRACPVVDQRRGGRS